MRNSQLYEQDFYAWANEQAALLRTGRLTEADIEHIAEEIESMGKAREAGACQSPRGPAHAPAEMAAPASPTRHKLAVDDEEQRQRLADHLADNPSLRATLSASLGAAYRLARIAATRDTGLRREAFPPTCPWSPAQTMAEDFWPGDEVERG